MGNVMGGFPSNVTVNCTLGPGDVVKKQPCFNIHSFTFSGEFV